MKASELIVNLSRLIEAYGDLELIYAHDDEGNGFSGVGYGPSLYESSLGYFYTEGDAIELGVKFTPNCICIN